MKKIEHIGVAVKNISEANEIFEKLLGKKAYKNEVVENENVTTSFFDIGETKMELLEGGEKSAIEKYINKKGEGIHHLAFEVDKIEEEVKRLKNEGFRFINEEPRKGADNKSVVFLHPSSCNGILVELCQDT
ncbi:MAG: methylmalonyl-CoA epimerase [Flavobacteriales bacterium]